MIIARVPVPKGFGEVATLQLGLVLDLVSTHDEVQLEEELNDALDWDKLARAACWWPG